MVTHEVGHTLGLRHNFRAVEFQLADLVLLLLNPLFVFILESGVDVVTGKMNVRHAFQFFERSAGRL